MSTSSNRTSVPGPGEGAPGVGASALAPSDWPRGAEESDGPTHPLPRAPPALPPLLPPALPPAAATGFLPKNAPIPPAGGGGSAGGDSDGAAQLDSSLDCVASPNLAITCLPARTADGFTSMTRSRNSAATAYTAAVLPAPVGPSNNKRLDSAVSVSSFEPGVASASLSSELTMKSARDLPRCPFFGGAAGLIPEGAASRRSSQDRSRPAAPQLAHTSKLWRGRSTSHHRLFNHSAWVVAAHRRPTCAAQPVVRERAAPRSNPDAPTRPRVSSGSDASMDVSTR
mmetsp:Transcript_26600/g.85936  ORF Transcript_26600/g.85936 Transcript_26600/m.85936 type:complete len:284 (-) Transcript_26600:1455-2306(-)